VDLRRTDLVSAQRQAPLVEEVPERKAPPDRRLDVDGADSGGYLALLPPAKAVRAAAEADPPRPSSPASQTTRCSRQLPPGLDPGRQRTRWLAVKLSVADVASMSAAGLLSLMVTW